MPGVIMENGCHGSHTNHERERLANGINGMSTLQDKGKPRPELEPLQNMTPTSPTMPNGLNGPFRGIPPPSEGPVMPSDLKAQLSQLPDEISHITDGYMSLSKLLERVALKTHVEMGAKIQELAQLPLPISVAANSSASHKDALDDNSTENVTKKQRLLDFAQKQHAEWVKTLVITHWSRRAEDVSKCIDLKVHLDGQKSKYDLAVDAMALMKRGLGAARLPNPDFNTALQVLSMGEVREMPDIGYIEPPPLTRQDLLKVLKNLNTLLSIRLNIHEHDKIPSQFKDYSIQSGRVTFRVAGEYEVDLTIADEDPELQFWFIDFRFLFSPSLVELSLPHRARMEAEVNSALMKDGLIGCYRELHSLVLDHKISEFRRQASELARKTWVESLQLEQLNRVISIHYWKDRYGKNAGPKSWILLGVHSGKRKDGRPDPKSVSRLAIRWFRDGKEVQNSEVSLDSVNISTESLLKSIIANHVNHMLTTAYNGLLNKPIFSSGELALSLSTSLDEPSDSELNVQLCGQEAVSVRIEPITGRIVLSPASLLTIETESRFNATSRDPAKDIQSMIESLRCQAVGRAIITRSMSVGWMRLSPPIIVNDGGIKALMPKHAAQFVWFRRPGWKGDWFLVVSLSLSGESWWLLEISPVPKGFKVISKISIPIKSPSTDTSYTFLSTLNVFAAALVSHHANLKELQGRKANHHVRDAKPSAHIKVPNLYIRLSQILPSGNKSPRTGRIWAKETILITFQGLDTEMAFTPPYIQQSPVANLPANQALGAWPLVSPEGNAIVLTQARLAVQNAQSLSILTEMVDKDIAFNCKTGVFAFRLRTVVGESAIPTLIKQILRVKRLVDFVGILHRHKDTLPCESISLASIAFTYRPTLSGSSNAMGVDVVAPEPYKATITFPVVGGPMTLSFNLGNPHLRIKDILGNVLNNQKQGLDTVATTLPLTLPLLQAFDSIESAWEGLSERGTPMVMPRKSTEYTLRYNLNSFAPGSTSPMAILVVFSVILKDRRGEPWWWIQRTKPQTVEGEDDEVDAALKPLWTSHGQDWLGMDTSAVAHHNGIVTLLGKLDDVVRGVQLVVPPQPQPQSQAPVPGPVQQPLHQARPQQAMISQQQQQLLIQKQRQQLQQPTPNQSQSQGHSQGRPAPQNREIVEID